MGEGRGEERGEGRGGKRAKVMFLKFKRSITI